jgi:hypothetical protein
MDFPSLIADFAARHGVEGLADDGGVSTLDIDGIPVTLVTAGGQLAVSAEIGDPPAEGEGEFAALLLEANLESEAFFAKSGGTGRYVAVRHLPLDTLDPAAFDAALESLVNLAETWRKLLEDFRPSAPAAAGTADTPAFGADGFLAV